MVFKDLNIGLIVSGGIAAYKVTELVRQLIKKQANVRVMMTENATEFIPPLTLQILSRQSVLIDTFDEIDPQHVQHIEFADWCDLAILAPATANIIGKLANGIADDMASTSLLAITAPLLIVPAMNHNMYHHPAVERNLKRLEKDGYQVMEPDSGFLAEGYEGKGRLPEISQIVLQAELLAARNIYPQLLKNKKVIVSAGGTIERIDPVRYISNDSSGKMGYAMAHAAAFLGAEVCLVTTKTNLPKAEQIELVKVESAAEMQAEIEAKFDLSDYVVMAAAVSDYRVADRADKKIKKTAQTKQQMIQLIENPDILAGLGQKKTHQTLIGFAAESERLVEYAEAKLERKNIEWIIANDISQEGIGFNSDDNQVTLIGRNDFKETFPVMSKADVALALWRKIALQE